ncbi:MAG: hypothetical protein U0521_07640 [Anaerolineae bacterium]
MGTNPFQFDPDVVAKYEVEGWKAYEDRNWLRLLWLVVALAQAQFRIPFPYSIVAAYYVARASAAWVPKEHDVDAVRGYLERFYRLAQRYSGLTFDTKQAAAEETVYWEAHRRLVGHSDKTDFVEALTALHATIFALTREQAGESAACAWKPTTCLTPSPSIRRMTRRATGCAGKICCAAATGRFTTSGA